jgi:hypothetical protein
VGSPLFDLHFNFTVMEPALRALDAAYSDLNEAWRNAEGVTYAGEAGFGGADRLGGAFLPGYTSRADTLREEAELRLDQFDELNRSGTDCFDIYAQGNSDAAVPFMPYTGGI